MRHAKLGVLFAVSLALTVGCGGTESGPAKPATDMDELQQFLADNPDQNVDGLEGLDEQGDFDE